PAINQASRNSQRFGCFGNAIVLLGNECKSFFLKFVVIVTIRTFLGHFHSNADSGYCVSLKCPFLLDQYNYYSKLNECSLVTNVYKHGDGASFDSLRSNYPEYFPVNTNYDSLRNASPADLTASNKQLDAFSSAIVSFWEDIPENVYDDDGVKTPNWLKKAFEKDA